MLSGMTAAIAVFATLPLPTGQFPVGRISVEWTDASRIEPLAPDRSGRRLMVDIWYPADSASSTAAEYLDAPAYEQALGAEGLRKQLGAAYDAIRAGSVRTHAVAGARFNGSIQRSPVLIFSPGGGMIRELYSAQLEDLASHGYIVAAITHPYDGMAVIFPDGSRILHTRERWPAVPSFEGESNLNQLEWHAEDIRFVLDQLGRLGGSLPIAGRLDLARVGAFGHSFGGIAAAHACQKDSRIKACLNQDGAVAMSPYYLDARGWGMNQPFLLMERTPRNDPPSDAEVAEMKVSRERLNEIVTRLRAHRELVLRRTGKGSDRVLLRRDATTHMDFSDLPLLGARNSSEAENRARVLGVIRGYTRAFFDKHLRGMRRTLLDRPGANDLVDAIERFEPTRRR